MGGSFSVSNDLEQDIEVRHFTAGGGIALQGKGESRNKGILIKSGEEKTITEEVAQGSHYYIVVQVLGTPIKAGSNFYSIGEKKLLASHILKKGGARPPKAKSTPATRSSPRTPTAVTKTVTKDRTFAVEVAPLEGSQAEGISKVTKETDNIFSDAKDLDTVVGTTVTLSKSIPIIFNALLANESDFCLVYHTKRQDENIKVTDWEIQDNCVGTRNVTLVGATTFGPKSYCESQRFVYSKVDDVETMSYSRSGQVPDIMYGQTFRTETLHVFEKRGDGPVTMATKARVTWVDTCPKLLKMTISSSAMKAMKQSSSLFEGLVQDYVNNFSMTITETVQVPGSAEDQADAESDASEKRPTNQSFSSKPADVVSPSKRRPPGEGSSVSGISAPATIKPLHIGIMLLLVCLFSFMGAYIGCSMALSGLSIPASVPAVVDQAVNSVNTGIDSV
eukprot:TRINITY_DN2028_c1_g1_i1.p1 TRINITY_DN2028_c1_g1~~TRINITY_DN2028_c1_g1_i1.p1  ORF type:complete len:464 (+),score=84.57 TRINITY_DN2028_c1_g1_i1:51-1394(+)